MTLLSPVFYTVCVAVVVRSQLLSQSNSQNTGFFFFSCCVWAPLPGSPNGDEEDSDDGNGDDIISNQGREYNDEADDDGKCSDV